MERAASSVLQCLPVGDIDGIPLQATGARLAVSAGAVAPAAVVGGVGAIEKALLLKVEVDGARACADVRGDGKQQGCKKDGASESHLNGEW